MASKLIALASDAADVRAVIAHTLPEPNASTRVLEKAGMTFVGEVKRRKVCCPFELLATGNRFTEL